MGLDDVALEFELTANRADCFSVLGLAREVAVLTGGTLTKPMLNLQERGSEKASSLVSITITDATLCPRFAARVLQDVKVGTSPLWLQRRIQVAGMRPINNVVDVTNFVMLEMGQPMHAYDYNLLSRHSIVVRRAETGERLTTLDDVKRQLTPDMLVIGDAVQAVGIAGVMGGLVTEVTGNTQNVLLEAAAFNGPSIRRTSRGLGLRSEASGRFERGVDTANIVRALDRAAKLLEDMGACKVCPGIVDSYPGMLLPRQVSFTPKEINDHLGLGLSKGVMVDILRRLDFEVDSQSDKIMVTVPTWRGDITGPADISEEIARIYGYNNVPSTTPAGNMARGGQSYPQSVVDSVRNILSGAGLDEVISFSFTHPSTLDKLNIPSESPLRKSIQVLNPITDDFPLLRTTLLGGVMETIARNLSRKNDDMSIYEIGAVYLPTALPLTELPEEPQMICGALVGKRYEISWNLSRETVDFYDAKGVVEVLLAGLGIKGYQVTQGEHVSLHPGKTAVFSKNGNVLGTVGEVHPKVLQAFGINRKVYVFELNMKGLIAKADGIAKYQPLPKFPAINRDLALVLPLAVSADAVIQTIQENGGAFLVDTRLFDVYTGEQVETGSRSLAVALTFRAQDKTLTDDEIEEHYNNIVVSLRNGLSATLRI